MRKTVILGIALVLSLGTGLADARQYTNPVLNSDYSDPDVVCVDGEYWMTASSFNCVPGLQILHSYNLVDWEAVGAALPADSPYWDGALGSPDHGNGVWAPSIRYRESDGRFYIFWGDPDRGIFQVSADDPRGRWTDPVCVIAGRGLIDPCPLFDDDGRVYLVHAWAGSRAGFKSILNVCELDSSCKQAISGQVLVFDGNKNGNLTVEGPKFYKHGGKYWVFAPAGGVKTGWQLALRSDTPYGPYEWKRVCEEASEADIAAGRAAPTHGPHQGGWVADASGRYWFLHFEDRYAWGRVVHLQPMSWTADGWCIIGKDTDGDGIGEPVSSFDLPTPFEQAKNQPLSSSVNGTYPAVGATETRTGFNGTAIPLNWQWHSRPGVDWAMPNPSEGCLRLNCLENARGWRNLWDTPNLLLEKVAGPSMELTARLVFRPAYEGDRAGLAVMGLDYSTLELFYDGEKVSLQRRLCTDADAGGTERITDSIPLETVVSEGDKPFCTVWVRVNVHGQDSAWPPAVGCGFSYSLDGRRFRPLGKDFTAREGKWIGAKAGFFATAAVKKNDGGSVEIF
ncbi:MAG: glycoside hydrolase 43 family protein [Bacteroidales bacterium]|nr:glycoside hydrolase 43 family protein [Bacteroidales bacterium]